MTQLIDPATINHMTVALRLEMTPSSRSCNADADVLFMGGASPSEADERDIAAFGLRKNYNIIFAVYDGDVEGSTPSAYHAVVTDGINQAVPLKNGRLWKRDRRGASILLFPNEQAVIKVSAEGRMIVRKMASRYHDQGYDLAAQGVAARAARQPGHGPVVATVGDLVTVSDIKDVAATFVAAA